MSKICMYIMACKIFLILSVGKFNLPKNMLNTTNVKHISIWVRTFYLQLAIPFSLSRSQSVVCNRLHCIMTNC